MKKFALKFIITILLLSPIVLFAQVTGPITPTSTPALDKLQTVGSHAGYAADTDETTVLEIVGTGISVGLGLLGVIFIILILLAGYNWMTAAGDEEKITKAGRTIRSAIIGLLIIVAAFAIWMFVSQIVIGGSGGNTSPTTL